MERIYVTNKEEMETAIEKAHAVLDGGGIILYPTDTLYGIGADATSIDAINKVFEFKGRDDTKPLSVMVSDLDTASKYIELDSVGESLAKKILPGPFTLVLPKKSSVSEILTAGEATLGIRIPDSYFCISLAKKFGKPITATSANVSGKENCTNIDEILEQFGEKSGAIDLVIDVGDLGEQEASTVLKIEDDRVEILRHGRVNHTAMLHVTKKEQPSYNKQQ